MKKLPSLSTSVALDTPVSLETLDTAHLALSPCRQTGSRKESIQTQWILYNSKKNKTSHVKEYKRNDKANEPFRSRNKTKKAISKNSGRPPRTKNSKTNTVTATTRGTQDKSKHPHSCLKARYKVARLTNNEQLDNSKAILSRLDIKQTCLKIHRFMQGRPYMHSFVKAMGNNVKNIDCTQTSNRQLLTGNYKAREYTSQNAYVTYLYDSLET